MLQGFKKIRTDSENVDRVQDNLLAVLNPVTQDRMLNRLEYSATINTTDTIIPHALGYQPVGWIITDKTATGDVWRINWDNTKITLRASAPVTIKIILF